VPYGYQNLSVFHFKAAHFREFFFIIIIALKVLKSFNVVGLVLMFIANIQQWH